MVEVLDTDIPEVAELHILQQQQAYYHHYQEINLQYFSLPVAVVLVVLQQKMECMEEDYQEVHQHKVGEVVVVEEHKLQAEPAVVVIPEPLVKEVQVYMPIPVMLVPVGGAGMVVVALTPIAVVMMTVAVVVAQAIRHASSTRLSTSSTISLARQLRCAIRWPS